MKVSDPEVNVGGTLSGYVVAETGVKGSGTEADGRSAMEGARGCAARKRIKSSEGASNM